MRSTPRAWVMVRQCIEMLSTEVVSNEAVGRFC